jgi:hypothetical protein
MIMETTFPREGILVKGKYWRSQDQVRVREELPNNTINELLVEKGVIRQVSSSRDPASDRRSFGAARRPISDRLGLCDIWTAMFLNLSGPHGRPFLFEEYLQLAKERPEVAREKSSGHNCIRVRLILDSQDGKDVNTVTLWHDESYNYLIRKAVMVFGKAELSQTESEILHFIEPKPGIYFPTKCRVQAMRNGKQIYSEMDSISELSVNEPIPSSVFRLPPIPSGTFMTDRIEGTTYSVDANWQRISRSTPIRTLAVVANADGKESGYRSQSTAEPKPFAWWLLPASLVLLVLALCVLVFRQLRGRWADLVPRQP